MIFLRSLRSRFAEWWRAPITRKDRLAGALFGGIGFFWIGLLFRVFTGPMPVSLGVVLCWAAASAGLGALLGLGFPKVTTVVAFPFLTWG